jgi:TonB family protein
MPRPVKKQYNARSTDMPDAQAHNSDPQTSANAPGTTEGTDPVGMSMGPDVRPAVEITNLTPPVTRSDLAGLDGEVWVEVTIDEQGNVTGIKLLKGLRQAIDDKVIATVWKWHYIPATKNGVAIPSKYDAHFPYHG